MQEGREEGERKREGREKRVKNGAATKVCMYKSKVGGREGGRHTHLPGIVHQSKLVSLDCLVAPKLLHGPTLVVGVVNTAVVELLKVSLISGLCEGGRVGGREGRERVREGGSSYMHRLTSPGLRHSSSRRASIP